MVHVFNAPWKFDILFTYLLSFSHIVIKELKVSALNYAM